MEKFITDSSSIIQEAYSGRETPNKNDYDLVFYTPIEFDIEND
jgi:hypothetical protein